MTDKVFYENPTYERNRKVLIKKLEDLFQVDKVYFVPQQPHDFTGHTDGMVRFLDDNTVIINDYAKEDKAFKRAFLIALDNAGLDYIEIPYNPYNNKKDSQANGIYINYLQMEGVVILPVFGQKEDELAVKQFETLFKGYRIETVDSNEIAKKGGILNCITWNIKVD
jgi:agmatine deiminase